MSDEKPAAEPASPLAEASPTSLDELFERVNQKLIGGMPETITTDDMKPVTATFRAERLRFLAEQDRLGRAPPAPRKKKPTSVANAVTQVEDDL